MTGVKLYQFRVRGQISDRAVSELSPMVVEDVQVVTVMNGYLDEAGAHGMVERIHRFGLDLISMERVGGCGGQTGDAG